MLVLNALRAALAWLGRQGTRALAASLVVGLATPQLAAYVKPYLGELVFVLLLFSYLRTDPAAFARYIRAPRLTIIASLWVMLVLPLVLSTVYLFSGLREASPPIYMMMVLQSATAPITSSAAFAALMDLDVAFSLAAMILSNALSPLTTVAFSYLFLGNALFSPIELGIKLFVLFAGAGVAAYLVRRVAGADWIERQKEPIDGLNVLTVFAFIIAAMENVPAHVINDPLFSLGLFAVIVALALATIGLSVLVFWRVGADRGLVIGLLAAFRNLGMVMAALGASLPDLAWFYFAVAQFPIFLLPLALQGLARRRAKSR
jgi:BASS family bile acid:Na+ symporter